MNIESLLVAADIRLNGDRPCDIKVHNPKLLDRVLAEGSLGFGEAYMDGWWDSPALDELFVHILTADLDRKVRKNFSLLAAAIWARITNRQSRRRAFQIGERHYDIGNDLFEKMLGPTMAYSCGYWSGIAEKNNPNELAHNLDNAQNAKFDLICRKLGLQPGMRLLDIGCGWGTLAKYAAEKYGVSVVGVTVSKEQAAWAKQNCGSLPVEFRLTDYRALNEKFDRIVSVGMFEHVGYKNYRTFMEVVKRCLTPDGLMLLHTIGGLRSVTATDPWIEKYIFPNSMLPSIKQIAAAAEDCFVIEDLHNFGADYDTTLMAWVAKIEAGWNDLPARYDERFRRMWRYYLLSCAASFRARRNQLWQIVLSPEGLPGGYKTVR